MPEPLAKSSSTSLDELLRAKVRHDERQERRLWPIDLNDVEVYDEAGRRLEVVETLGSMNGPLMVRVSLDV